MNPRYKAILFDMDGLMLDSERIYYRAQQEAASQLGYAASHELMISFIGHSAEACELTMVEAAGNRFGVEEYHALWTQLWRDIIRVEGVPVKEGLLPLLDWLRDTDAPRAVVTSSLDHEAELCLEATGLNHYFEHVVTGDQIEHMKPAPDIYLLAAKRIGVEPQACIALEDSDAGVIAAANAGMRVVMIPDLRKPSEEALQAAYCMLPSLVQAHERILEWLNGAEDISNQ